jgi:hypothetical protein
MNQNLPVELDREKKKNADLEKCRKDAIQILQPNSQVVDRGGGQ